MVMSSAYVVTWMSRGGVGRSDMKILNKVGDSTPPWGTPALNCFLNEFLFLYWENALRPLI